MPVKKKKTTIHAWYIECMMYERCGSFHKPMIQRGRTTISIV